MGLVKRALAGWGADLPALLEQEANAQALAMGTADHRMAVNRFLDKQAPLFQWPARS